MGQNFHTGGTGGGVYSPPPGLLCCPKGVSEQSEPVGLFARTLSLGIPPQGTSIGQGWSERTPDNVLVYPPYLDPPPPPPGGGGWGGLAVTNFVLKLLMGCEIPDHKVNYALR